MKSPIPPTLLTAISSIQCPLHGGPPVPMCYEPLDRLSEIRQCTSQPQPLPQLIPLLKDIPSTIATLTNNESMRASSVQQDNVILSMSLILLGNGFMDEAHNLVTPLSWSQDTHFGHGPSRTSQIDEATISMASYIHALIHRKEGFAMGEYNMMGFANANYWSRVVMTSRGVDSIPFGRIRNKILALVQDGEGSWEQKEGGGVGGTMAQRWCQERIVEEGGPEDPQYWESRALHELCAQVIQSSSRESFSTNDPHHLKQFAEKASEVELRTLLTTCLERAGYECNTIDVGIQKQKGQRKETSRAYTQVPEQSELRDKVDIHAAQRAANKLSSAHIDSFRSNQFVLLRNTLGIVPGNSDFASNSLQDSQQVISVAAGLACRLLNSPACRRVYPGENHSQSNPSRVGVHIFLPVTEIERNKCASFLSQLNLITYGGGDMMLGDAHMVATHVLTKTNHLSWCYTFVPCDKGDAANIFVDRFYGTRGETPTSVIQWSKGTIFEMDNNK